MKPIFIALFGLALVGCNDIKGQLTTQAPLELTMKNGKTVVVPVGDFDAKVKVAKDGKELKLEIKDVDGKNRKLTLKPTRPTKLPRKSGTFEIKGADVGQSWDIRGELRNETTTSDLRMDVEGCTVQYQVRRCNGWGRGGGWGYDGWGHDRYNDGHWRNCYWDTISFPGQRRVSYREIREEFALDLAFVEAASEMALGDFKGGRVDTRRAYENIGPCYRYYY